MLPLQNRLNRISNNLQDIWTMYSFHGALSSPCNMLIKLFVPICVNPILAITFVLQYEISSHVNPIVVHFHALLKDPLLHCTSIRYMTRNMIVLVVMVISISCDICQKVFVLPLQNQLNQISSNLQDIVTRYSFHGTIK